MDYKLDILKDIPYYTNRNDRLFGWFSVYNDGAIIQELNSFSYVDYTKIPKNKISYFGLYGCGFHLISDFNTGSMYIYGKGTNKEFLVSSVFQIYSDKILREHNKFLISNIQPFQLKGFIYDMPIDKSNKEFCMTDKYYAGYTSELLLDEKNKLEIKVYFSLNILKYPNSIGIIFNILPKRDTEETFIDKYVFSVVEIINERYNDGREESHSNIIEPNYISHNFKKKIIVNYRN